eukprot:scaffold703_cov245-Pinguiococcus_pyrenoidosus.AAC.17
MLLMPLVQARLDIVRLLREDVGEAAVRLFYSLLVDDDQLHLLLDQTARPADVDCRFLLVASEHPDLDPGLHQDGDGLRDFVLQPILDGGGPEEFQAVLDLIHQAIDLIRVPLLAQLYLVQVGGGAQELGIPGLVLCLGHALPSDKQRPEPLLGKLLQLPIRRVVLLHVLRVPGFEALEPLLHHRVRALAEEPDLPAFLVLHDDGHPLPRRVELEDFEQLVRFVVRQVLLRQDIPRRVPVLPPQPSLPNVLGRKSLSKSIPHLDQSGPVGALAKVEAKVLCTVHQRLVIRTRGGIRDASCIVLLRRHRVAQRQDPEEVLDSLRVLRAALRVAPQGSPDLGVPEGDVGDPDVLPDLVGLQIFVGDHLAGDAGRRLSDRGRAAAVLHAPDDALSEVHHVAGERSRLVREDVADLPKLLVELHVLDLARAVRLGVVHLQILLHEIRLARLHDGHADVQRYGDEVREEQEVVEEHDDEVHALVPQLVRADTFAFPERGEDGPRGVGEEDLVGVQIPVVLHLPQVGDHVAERRDGTHKDEERDDPDELLVDHLLHPALLEGALRAGHDDLRVAARVQHEASEPLGVPQGDAAEHDAVIRHGLVALLELAGASGDVEHGVHAVHVGIGMLELDGGFELSDLRQAAAQRGLARLPHLQVGLSVEALRLDVAEARDVGRIRLRHGQDEQVRRADLPVLDTNDVPHLHVHPRDGLPPGAVALEHGRQAAIRDAIRLVLLDVLQDGHDAVHDEDDQDGPQHRGESIGVADLAHGLQDRDDEEVEVGALVQRMEALVQEERQEGGRRVAVAPHEVRPERKVLRRIHFHHSARLRHQIFWPSAVGPAPRRRGRQRVTDAAHQAAQEGPGLVKVHVGLLRSLRSLLLAAQSSELPARMLRRRSSRGGCEISAGAPDVRLQTASDMKGRRSSRRLWRRREGRTRACRDTHPRDPSPRASDQKTEALEEDPRPSWMEEKAGFSKLPVSSCRAEV